MDRLWLGFQTGIQRQGLGEEESSQHRREGADTTGTSRECLAEALLGIFPRTLSFGPKELRGES